MKKNIFIFFTILLFASCTSAPPEMESWEIILDSIPWEDRIIGVVSMSTNTIPNELSNVLYEYGYRYVNSSYLKEEIEEHIYELKRENAAYYSDDDTFVFAGKFFPDDSTIWLVFSKDKDYPLYMGPEDLSQYNLIKTILTH
jgi:hypothetical protein